MTLGSLSSAGRRRRVLDDPRRALLTM